MWLLVRVQPNRGPSCWGRLAHSCGEERAGLELLQTHGAGVGAKEQDEGHEGDVWDELAGLPHQLAFVPQALRLGEGRPCGVPWLQRQPRDWSSPPALNHVYTSNQKPTLESFDSSLLKHERVFYSGPIFTGAKARLKV